MTFSKKIISCGQQQLARLIRRLSVALPCCLLGACAFQHYDAQPISVQGMARDLGGQTLDSPLLRDYIQAHAGQAQAAWPPQRWNLDTLTLAALFFNPDLQAARAELATTEGSQITAAQRPNPILQFPLQWTTNPNPGESPWIVGLALDIPIETAGKRDYRLSAAGHRLSAARLQVANVAWGVRSRLREQLLVLWSLSERTGLLQQQLELDQKLVAMLEKRLLAGYASTWDVNQQRLLMIQDRHALMAAQQEMAVARVRLATVLGVRAQALDGVELDLGGFAQAAPELPEQEVRLQALMNRADVLQGLAHYEASQAALQLEVARQYPNLHLGPGYTFDQGARKLGFDFTGLELPVLNRNQGPIAEARGRRLEMAARVKQLEAQAFADADGAAAAYSAAREAVLQGKDQLAVQDRQLSYSRRALELGQDDRLSLDLARKAGLAARLALLDAAFQMQQAVGKVEDAMQRPISGAPLLLPLSEAAK